MTNILVMDDDPTLLDALCDVLVSAGHAVTPMANGSKALELVHAKDIELVIIDLFMPDKEGLETIIELRRQCPRLKIIAISGGGRKGAAALDPTVNLAMAMKFGAAVAINKPFTPDQLTSAISTALA